MLHLNYRIEHRDRTGHVVAALDGEVSHDRLDEEIPKEINVLFGAGFNPLVGESIVIRRTGPIRHVVLGISTHNASRRTIRRLLERLWPIDTAPIDVSRKAAFLLVRDGKTYLRLSPFNGLTVTRTF